MKTRLELALEYAELGYQVFPVVPLGKMPATKNGVKDATTDSDKIEAWWRNTDYNIGLACNGLLVVDIDAINGASNQWPGRDEEKADLWQGPVSRTPNGGTHHLFRLLQGQVWKNSASAIAKGVDTKTTGGYIVAAGSSLETGSYEWMPGSGICEPSELPCLPQWLIELLEKKTGSKAKIGTKTEPVNSQAIEEFGKGSRNQRLFEFASGLRRNGLSENEILAVLLQRNAVACKPPLGEREVEAIAKQAAKYEPTQVAVALTNGWAETVDLSRLMQPRRQEGVGIIDKNKPVKLHKQTQPQKKSVAEKKKEVAEQAAKTVKYKPLALELLRVPGFISEVMAYTLATSPYPNPHMAFCAALSLLATLSGRIIAGPSNTRTNLLLIGLADPGAGKDRGRQVNAEIMYELGLQAWIGDTFASGEGLQDAMAAQNTMLFQTDEFDGLLLGVKKSRDARHESIMTSLLRFYSASSSMMMPRRKAGQAPEEIKAIVEPHLVLFGTATPAYYYEAISERMAANGFLARMLIIKSDKRGERQNTDARPPLPKSIIELGRRWKASHKVAVTQGEEAAKGFDWSLNTGNLQGRINANNHSTYHVGYANQEARKLAIEYANKGDEEYKISESKEEPDPSEMATWSRFNENSGKLALLYALSENPENPAITEAAVQWAFDVCVSQTKAKIEQTKEYMEQTNFLQASNRVMELLRKNGGSMSQSDLRKHMHRTEQRLFLETLYFLGNSGEIIEQKAGTKTRPKTILCLPEFCIEE